MRPPSNTYEKAPIKAEANATSQAILILSKLLIVRTCKPKSEKYFPDQADTNAINVAPI